MSSLSLLKKSSFIVALLVLASCQNLRTREDVKKERPTSAPTPMPSSSGTRPPVETDDGDEGYTVAPQPPPPPEIPAMPKIGLILGGGGARTYAHVGFLHELVKAKVPVTAIAGIEFAAPMAALYAKKELANDVEWQMFKLKDEDIYKKSILGGSTKKGDVTNLKEFLSAAFAKTKVSDLKIPFTCPTYNFKNNQVLMMNKGSVEQVMYSCMAYPPYYKPLKNSVAGVREVTSIASYLRSKGANYIVFVNVLSPPGVRSYTPDATSVENVLWSEVGGLYNRPLQGVDTMVSLEAGNYGILDFDRKREIMNKGAESTARQIKTLTGKWGL